MVGQTDHEGGPFAFLGFEVDRALVLVYDHIVRDREALSSVLIIGKLWVFLNGYFFSAFFFSAFSVLGLSSFFVSLESFDVSFEESPSEEEDAVVEPFLA